MPPLKLLVLTSRFPYPLEKGDKLRIYHQLKFLAQHHEIHLVTIDRDIKEDTLFKSWGIKVYQFKLSMLQRVWAMFSGLFIARPLQVSYFYNAGIRSKIAKIFKANKIELVHCHLARMAPYAIHLDTDNKVLDYMDAFSLIANRRAKTGKLWERLVFSWEANKMKLYETKIASKFRDCLAISTADATYLQESIPYSPHVIPNGIDLSFFKENDRTDKTYDLVFVGNMSYHPNIAAVDYLLDHIWPSLKDRLPELKILIAGVNPSARLKQRSSKNITVSGWMEDIRDAYWSSKIMIAPIIGGSGLQNKVLEAFACGVPVISSATVANGIDSTGKAPLIVAKDIAEYSEAIYKMLHDNEQYHQLKAEGIRYVHNNFDWKRSNNTLNTIITS